MRTEVRQVQQESRRDLAALYLHSMCKAAAGAIHGGEAARFWTSYMFLVIKYFVLNIDKSVIIFKDIKEF